MDTFIGTGRRSLLSTVYRSSMFHQIIGCGGARLTVQEVGTGSRPASYAFSSLLSSSSQPRSGMLSESASPSAPERPLSRDLRADATASVACLGEVPPLFAPSYHQRGTALLGPSLLDPVVAVHSPRPGSPTTLDDCILDPGGCGLVVFRIRDVSCPSFLMFVFLGVRLGVVRCWVSSHPTATQPGICPHGSSRPVEMALQRLVDMSNALSGAAPR